MKNDLRTAINTGLARLMPLLAAVIFLSSCASTYSPNPQDDPRQAASFQQKTIADVTVSVAILTDAEAREHFGVDLGAQGVQALWVSVRNASNFRYWFVRNATDPDLYSSEEAALLVHKQVPKADWEAMRQYFRDETIRVLMEPGHITEGHIFLPKEEGGRYVEILLASDSYEAELALTGALPPATSAVPGSYNELRFGFALTLPDGIFDYELLDTSAAYEGRKLPDLDADGLREALEQLPCCATNADGDGDGDPLNLVMVGASPEVMFSLSKCGWSFTHRITMKTVGRMIEAAMEGEGYAVAPVSSLYVFDRKQDIALQRARRNIAQRNHLRLWLAPFTFEQRPVWVGQVSRDIGVKLTTKSPTLTTHVIDPEVDLTREYLLHSLLAEGFVQRFGFVDGSTFASIDDPAHNLTGDPYYSDGLRLVVILSRHPVPYSEVRNLLWEESDAPVAEGQSAAANDNVRPISAEGLEK